MNPSEPPAAGSKPVTFQTAWSHALNSNPRGLVLARERDAVFAWDQTHWLYLLKHDGQRQGQARFSGAIVSACCADDGSAYAAVGGRGEICWLAPDLMTRWQHTLSHPALTAAMDPFGQYLAVADNRGQVHIFNQLGQQKGRVETPRPLHHLAFVPAAPALVGSSDYGLVACFDLAGTTRWRDGLVAHAGSLTLNEDGSQILIACFSDGLQCYSLADGKQGRIAVAESCRLASLAFTGRFILVAGLTNRLMLLGNTGQTLGTHRVDKPIAALALSALGDYAVIALTDGPIMKFNLVRSY